MPRMRPLDLAQSHSEPSGMGVESIRRSRVLPWRRAGGYWRRRRSSAAGLRRPGGSDAGCWRSSRPPAREGCRGRSAGRRSAGLPREAFADGVAVKIDAGTIFEPDASVVCGPRKEDDTIVASDPTVVVEVLSPSTAAIDHGRKLSGYFAAERRALFH